MNKCTIYYGALGVPQVLNNAGNFETFKDKNSDYITVQ